MSTSRRAGAHGAAALPSARQIDNTNRRASRVATRSAQRMDIADLVIDPAVSAEGVWAEYREGVAFLISSTNTADFALAQERIYGPIIDARASGRDKEWVERAMAEAEVELYCTHVLRGWRGLESSGKPLEFSIETAKRLLSQPGAHHVFRFIRNSAARLDLFRAARTDALGKP